MDLELMHHMQNFKRDAVENDVDRIAVSPLAVLLTEQVTWSSLLSEALSKTNRSGIMDLHYGLGLLKSPRAYKPLSISMPLQRSCRISQWTFTVLFSGRLDCMWQYSDTTSWSCWVHGQVSWSAWIKTVIQVTMSYSHVYTQAHTHTHR